MHKNINGEIDEKEAGVIKSDMTDRVNGYRERTQGFLFCVDSSLSPRTRELKQRRVHQAKQSCVKEMASPEESLSRSRRTEEQYSALSWESDYLKRKTQSMM